MRSLLFAILVLACSLPTPAAIAAEVQNIELADLASGKAQIIGRLGVPLGRVVRIEATVIAAEKVYPDFSLFQGQYFLALQSIDGRKVHDLFIPFVVHSFAVSRLWAGRIELEEEFHNRLKRKPTEVEINKAEAELLSAGKRTFLVFEVLAFSGVPADLPKGVPLWSGTLYGPYSHVRVIQELETKQEPKEK